MAGPNTIFLPRTERYCDLRAKEHSEMRQKRVFTDFTISTDDGTFPCHKVLVASVSQYLKTMLTSDMVESAKMRVNFSHIKGEIISLILDYIYCGQVHFDASQLSDMLEACHYLQIQELIEMCVGEVQSQLTPTNVLEWLKLGQKLDLDNVQTNTIQFMIEHYTEVFQEQAFLLFSFIGILDYFSHLQGSDVSHDAMLSAAMRWVNHDAGDRTKHLKELMSKVSLEKCSHRALLEAVGKYATVIGPNAEVLTMMTNAMQKLMLEQEGQTDAAKMDMKTEQDTATITPRASKQNTSQNMVRPAKAEQKMNVQAITTTPMTNKQVTTQKIARPTKVNQMIVIVGGNVHLSANKACWKMNERNQFNPLTEIPADGLAWGHSVCATDGGFIVTGGEDSDICYIYTAATMSWRRMRKMLRERWFHGSICIKGVLYVLEGYISGRDATDSVDCMVLTQDTWEAGPRLPQSVTWPKVAEINDRLYVLDPQTTKLYQLDVGRRVWTERAPIPRCNDEVSMASVKGKLAVMGGLGRICALYDPASDVWTEGQQPRHEHYYGTLVYYDDRLLLMGGQWYENGTDEVEEYSVDDGTWSASDITMPIKGLFRHHALVLDSQYNG